mmetsp:Transcript_38981/g.89559  ORF Transcript_38981/g.89559 Transcript_38981/m.89559 type:complete len:144 (-) Transcript_38981:375-806(-)
MHARAYYCRLCMANGLFAGGYAASLRAFAFFCAYSFHFAFRLSVQNKCCTSGQIGRAATHRVTRVELRNSFAQETKYFPKLGGRATSEICERVSVEHLAQVIQREDGWTPMPLDHPSSLTFRNKLPAFTFGDGTRTKGRAGHI